MSKQICFPWHKCHPIYAYSRDIRDQAVKNLYSKAIHHRSMVCAANSGRKSGDLFCINVLPDRGTLHHSVPLMQFLQTRCLQFLQFLWIRWFSFSHSNPFITWQQYHCVQGTSPLLTWSIRKMAYFFVFLTIPLCGVGLDTLEESLLNIPQPEGISSFFANLFISAISFHSKQWRWGVNREALMSRGGL